MLYVQEAETAIAALLDVIKERGDRLLNLDVDRPTLSEVFEAVIEQQEKAGPKLRTTAPRRQERPPLAVEAAAMVRG